MTNPRYKELKYEGKTFTKKYEIDEILIDNNMNWFLDCEIENARIEIMKDTLIFNAGIFYNGVFKYGVVRDGDFRNIEFFYGVIYNGIFKRFTIKKGIIFNGVFIKGDILFADIRGGDFRDVNISKNVNKSEPKDQVKAQIQSEPVDVKQTQPKTNGQIQGQEGEEIQAQVQEKYIKTYEVFLNKIKK